MITAPSQQTTQQTRTQTMMPLLALCLGYFMTILDVTIVNVALVNIKEQLSANVTGLQWIVDGYALIFASFLLTGGALGDRRGSKTIFLVGFALFTLASTLCSLAPSLLVLQIARAFQGLGAALLVPNSLALLNTIYTDARKQAQAIGIWAAVASIGALSGPLLGGVLVNAFGWRSIFLINLPIGILGFLLTARSIAPSTPQGGRSPRATAHDRERETLRPPSNPKRRKVQLQHRYLHPTFLRACSGFFIPGIDVTHHAGAGIVGQHALQPPRCLRCVIGHDHLPGMDGVADADAATVMDGDPRRARCRIQQGIISLGVAFA
jgi:MFS family permease